jgi:hypothetical protein
VRSGFAASLASGFAALVLGGAAGPAFAFPDATPSARVDAEIRPNFGYLLRPSLRRHHYDSCRYRWSRCYRGGGGYSRGYGGNGGGSDQYGPPPYGPDGGPGGYPPGYPDGGYQQDSIRVDCNVPAGNGGLDPLNDALYRVASGGVIYVRAGAACNATVFINRPVTIVGEGVPAFAPGPNPQPAALAPPQGKQAFVIAEGVKGVEIRDLIIECRAARDAACIEAYNADLALTRVQIRYQGNASALYASGGRLLIRGSNISGQTYDPTVVADGVDAQISDSIIRGESVGLDITLGGQSESLITNVGILAIRSTDPTERPEFGIMAHGARESSSSLVLENTTMWGWRTGLWIGRGATVKARHVRVSRAAVGVASGGNLVLNQSLIGGSDSGVYAFGGRTELHGVVVHEFTRKPVFADNGAILDDADVWIFPSACGGDYSRSRWNCRLAGQLPASYRDDNEVVTGPWGWSDESYRRIGAPPEPKHGWFGRRRH